MKIFKAGIGVRLAVGFGVLILFMVAIDIAGYWGTDKVTEITIRALKTDAEIAEHSARARANVLALRRYEKDMLINRDHPEKLAGHHESWKKEHAHLLDRLADIEKVVTLQQDKEMIAKMKAALQGYDASMSEVASMLRAGQIRSAVEGDAAIKKDPSTRWRRKRKRWRPRASNGWRGFRDSWRRNQPGFHGC